MAPLLPIDNPFPGIRSYEIDEDHLFYGRELQVEELLEKLARTRFLAIVGSSGCGKSSLIKAGVIPALLKNRSALFRTRWKIHLFRPSDDPVGNLARSLVVETNSAEEIAKKLRKSRDGLVQVIRDRVNPAEESVLFVIDQFEELFRFRKSRGSFQTLLESSGFVDMILHMLQQPEVPVYVILSMRTDFLDECNEFRGLSEKINQGYYLVPRMNPEERRLAITGPVNAMGQSIADDLVERLLLDVGDDPDQLPIMQHALMRSWDYWKLNRVGDQPIENEHYQAIGTMKEALSVHLEEIYAELKEDRTRYIAEKMFKALTDFTRESRGTRRPTQLGEIAALAGAREEEVVKVIEVFRRPGCAFLMPAAGNPLHEDSIIDISHESIMRVWARLRAWVEEETSSAQLYMRLSKSAELYQEGKTGLWINPELQIALQWKEQTKPNATWAMRYDPSFDRAINFLTHSRKQHEMELAKKENQQKRNLQRAKATAFILGAAALVSILFLLISLNLRFKAEESRREALKKEKDALFERKRMEEQRSEAILQKRISEQQQQISEQQEIITEQQRQYAVRQQMIAQEQTAVAIEQRKEAVASRQQALEAKEEEQKQRQEAVSQKNIADEERLRAEESERNAQRLRLLAIARSLAIQAAQLAGTIKDDLPGLLALEAYRINLANNGQPDDPNIYNALFSIAGEQIILRGHEDGVRSIILDEQENTLYSCGDDNQLLVWRRSGFTYTMNKLAVPKQVKGTLRCLGATPAAPWLVAGTTAGEVIIWDRSSPQSPPRIIAGHQSVINCLAMHPDGKHFFSAGSDGKLLMWKQEGNQFIKQTTDSVTGKISCAIFTRNGALLAYGTGGGLVRAMKWKSGPGEVTTLVPAGNSVFSMAFSPAGQSLVLGLSNGSLLTLNPFDPAVKPTEILGRHISAVTALAFSHSGSEIASSSYDRTIKLSGFPPREARPISIENHDLWIYTLHFSRDDKQLISGSADKTIRLVPTENEILAEKVRKELKRNMTTGEWQKMVGADIPYHKTRADLP